MFEPRSMFEPGFGPVYDPAAPPKTQEPRSLHLPQELPSQNEEVGVGYVALQGRVRGGVGITIQQAAPEYAVNLDIAKLEAAGSFDPATSYVPAWIPGTDPEQVRRIPINAIPADAPANGQVWGRQDGEWVEVESADAYTKAESDARFAPKATISTEPPSGGVDGDVWYQIT